MLNFSPKGSANASSSLSNTSQQSVAIDAARALITTIVDAVDKMKNIKVEDEEWRSPASERDKVYKFKRSLFIPNDSYSSLDDSNPEDKSEHKDHYD